MSEELGLQDVVRVLRKRLIWIILLTIIGALIAYVFSAYFTTPVYSASTQLIVNPKQNENAPLTYSDLQISLNLIETYKEVLKSPRILEKVVQLTGYSKGVGELNKHVKVNTVKQSQVLSVTVEDTSPERAAVLANAIAKVFQQEIPKILRVDNVEILAEAYPPSSPVRPKVFLNTLVGGVIGLFAGILLAFLLEALDTTFREEKQIEEVLGLPVLGEVGIVSTAGRRKRPRGLAPTAMFQEEEKAKPKPGTSTSGSPPHEGRVEV
ncbi:YveK family protein [Brockia lithotrophica]|uniref:Capsular polysaccharide biosynthesis protein n=1 Tax=Brockia lithotrophica TaxID=933949 RepID=A0A660KXL0_9BACL|nr:Wzz/FepE/Etk N-terminal domain-containing protein [Brockia lithotrophica]RKQ85530.1 capsular polysaccharide biosynthesis protein [Brockia lithotrophica]